MEVTCFATRIPSANVIGMDYDTSAIQFANRHYILPNLKYVRGDATRQEEFISYPLFDCIISFDTLEHTPHREIMLENLVNHLKPAGIFLFSTPCGSSQNDLHPLWGHHQIEYSTASLYDFLGRYFTTVCGADMPGFPNLDVFDVLNGRRSIITIA